MAVTPVSATLPRVCLTLMQGAKALTEQLEGDNVPFRTRLVVHGTGLTGRA